ncbi:MAG: pimeloyl-ACP methyl ester esterase BioH [Betaproteobacteria bacterium]
MNALHVEWSGSGPPLVLLHGWAMHGGLFAPLVPTLAARYSVAVVDLPGHGFSSALPLTSLDAMVAALAAEFAREAQPLHVLGWSLGGAVALRWAHVAPTRMARLLLVSSTPRFTVAPDWPHAMDPTTLARFGDELAAAYRLTLQRFLTLQVQGSDAGRASLHALREALFARGEPSPQALRAGLAILQDEDLRAEAAHIATPTLVVSGDRDALTAPAAGAWLAAAMPDARHVLIPGAAHAPFLSHREAFDTALTPFLDAR